MVVPGTARVVVIGDPERLNQLRPQLGSRCIDAVTLLSTEEFLRPHDTVTVEGEERRRALDTLYSSLRGKLLVRLVVTNLNPGSSGESAQAQDPDAESGFLASTLTRACDAWDQIEARLEDFLNDKAHQGMTFVTILITEEGEWRESNRGDLDRLCRPPNAVASAPMLHRRCYLITRLLEHGADQVVHARYAWPVLAGSLMDFLAWTVEKGPNGRQLLAESGLYAWRTLRWRVDVPAADLEQNLGSTLRRVNELLLRVSDDPLFPEPLPALPEAAPGAAFSAPSVIESEVERLERNAWTEVDPVALESGLRLQAPWAAATQRYADAERHRAIDAAAGSPQDEELSAVTARMVRALDAPGAVFPGMLPEDRVVQVRTDGIRSIGAARDAAAAALGRVGAYLEAHGEAAQAYLSPMERLVIGLILAAAFTWAVTAVAYTLGTILPLGTDLTLGAVWIAFWGVAGIGATLGIGHVLQRWRGESAKADVLCPAVHDYVAGESGIRTRIAESLRFGRAIATLRRRANARIVLHHRLARIETILQNEFRYSDGDDHADAVPQDPLVAEQRRVLGLIDHVFDPEIQIGIEDREVSAYVDRFRREWRRTLDVDARHLGFVPTATLIRLCRVHIAQLRESIHRDLRKKLVAAVRSAPDESVARLRSTLAPYTRGEGIELYTVDLAEKVGVYNRIWVLPEFQAAFEFASASSGRVFPIESGDFAEGLIACWHGELRIDYHAAPTQGAESDARLRFVATPRGWSHA